MSNGENQIELSSKESKIEVNEDDSKEKKSKKSVTFRERMIKLRKFITVEPFIVLYLVGNALLVVANQKFITERMCLVDLEFSVDICYKYVQIIEDNSTLEVSEQVASAIGDLYSWKPSLERILPSIFILNIGAWSDRTGNRKAVIIVPIIGQIFSSILYILAFFIPSMSVFITSIIDALITTLTGGLQVLLAGLFSYVADATDPELRTFKMGVIGIVVTTFSVIGSLVSGEVTSYSGYIIPFTGSLVCAIIGFLYTYFKIHDVNLKKEEGTLVSTILNFLNPKNIIESLSLLLLSKGRKFAQILLVLIGFIIFIGPLYGLNFTTYNYLLYRYNMNEVEFTRFDSTVQVMGIIGLSIGVKLFVDILKLHDCFLGAVSTASRATSNLIFAFAPNRVWLYIGAASDIFGTASATVIRSLATKIIDSDDVGKMCSLISFLEAVVGLAATPLYNQVWKNYKEVLPGASYLMGSILTLPNFIVMLLLYIIDRRNKRDVVTDPGAKEKHVYDNEITSL